MEYTVRRINHGDGPLLRDVRLRALKTDPHAFGATYAERATRPADDWTLRASQSAEGDAQFISLAIQDDIAVGMCGGHQPEEAPSTRVLYGTWVDPTARSRGLGSILVDAVVAWAKESGATALTLWVVTTNQPAIRLYRRAGFIETAKVQPLASDPSLDEVEMTLDLA